jgi:hypothetical protein
MKGIQIFFKYPPFFASMATAATFVQPIPICFGLSRSTRCGCCSYQVSSISVWRVNRYDHFCVFHFFSILAISMAMAAAILKKSTLKQHNFTWHMIFLQGFIKFDQGISKKSSGQKCGRIIITRYDYNLTIMKSPKPATDTIYPHIKFFFFF